MTRAAVEAELSDGQKSELLEQLLQQRAELEHQIALATDGAKPVDLDESIGRLSRVDAMQQQRMIAANRDAARQRRRQTEAALARCEADEYGDCSGCGEPIGYARLKARPESPLCVRCQSSREDAR